LNSRFTEAAGAAGASTAAAAAADGVAYDDTDLLLLGTESLNALHGFAG
jgi:hypothetical protein